MCFIAVFTHLTELYLENKESGNEEVVSKASIGVSTSKQNSLKLQIQSCNAYNFCQCLSGLFSITNSKKYSGETLEQTHKLDSTITLKPVKRRTNGKKSAFDKCNIL